MIMENSDQENYEPNNNIVIKIINLQDNRNCDTAG